VGIACVMTFVAEHGYKFDLLDIDINDYSDEDVEKYLSTHTYDVVLAGSIVTHYKWMKWLTATVKKYSPSAKVCVGNSVGGSIPELFLRTSKADAVIIGEGEFTCLEVLNAWRDGKTLHDIEGVAFMDNGNFVKTPKRKACNINELPMINWDLFDTERYFEKSFAGADGRSYADGESPRVMPISTARGCVFKCTFCHYVFWNDPYRHRSAESILTEARRNIEKYRVNYLNFWDDLSFSSLQQAEHIADAIIESGLKFDWNAAVRVDLFGNPKFPRERRLAVAKKFKESGCCSLGFSLESGNQDILEMMNKKIDAEYFYEQCSVLKEAGIICNTSIVFGYPIETADTIQQTFDPCLRVGIYPSIGFLMPLPATGMYEYAQKNGFITDEDRYLDSITERQDITLNMTKMTDAEIMNNIKEGGTRLNRMLDLGLNENTLIRTGGYRNHHKKTSDARPRLDTDNIKRNQNDVSFNYSQAVFEQDLKDKKAEPSAP
jgi:radical SAM superfamily enzyme YgiQ (UPF0313 family)